MKNICCFCRYTLPLPKFNNTFSWTRLLIINCQLYENCIYGNARFCLASLKALVENNYNVVGVVTVANKPSGRGQKLHQSPVKVYAESKGIPVLQPLKTQDEKFPLVNLKPSNLIYK